MIALATVKETFEYYQAGIPLSGPALPFTTRIWEYPWIQEALKYASVIPPGLLLDVGCACNPLMVELASRGYNVVGIDRYEKGADDNPDPIGWGLDKSWVASNLQLKVGDITAIPFPDGHFDAVYSVSTIEHLPGESIVLAAIHEMCRVLKPGGVLLITEDYVPSPVVDNIMIHECVISRETGRDYRTHVQAALEYGHFLIPHSSAMPSEVVIDTMRDRGMLQLCCAVHPDKHYHFTAIGYAVRKDRR